MQSLTLEVINGQCTCVFPPLYRRTDKLRHQVQFPLRLARQISRYPVPAPAPLILCYGMFTCHIRPSQDCLPSFQDCGIINSWTWSQISEGGQGGKRTTLHQETSEVLALSLVLGRQEVSSTLCVGTSYNWTVYIAHICSLLSVFEDEGSLKMILQRQIV